MKHKIIVGIAILMFILNIGIAEPNAVVRDKASMQPGKQGPSDQLVASNNFYDLIVENVMNSDGIGTYTVRTGSNHPATIAAGGYKQNVLYGGASGNPWSTYLTVKSYSSNTNYVTARGSISPDSGCTVLQLDYYLTSITRPTPTSILCVWDVIGENDFLKIKQNTFVDGTTLDDSKIGVTTTVKNTGYDTVKIGIRYEWDIMIAYFDNSQFRTKNPEGPWLNIETQWSNINYTHYEITDEPTSPTFYNLGTATGPSYLTPPPSPPDLLSYAYWNYSYTRAFNYTVQGLSGYDSAILYYWGDNLANAKVIAPGDSIMVTQYLFSSLFVFNYQVDNHIKNSNEGTYIGDNIYNLNGEGQTKTQNASTASPAIYNIKIENDGNGSDGFIVNEVLTDTRQSWDIAYYDALIGGNNITSQVRGAGWSTGSLNPGQFREIRMEVTPDNGVSNGSSKTIDVMSISANDYSKKDVVRTISTAVVQGVHDVGAYQIISPTGFINTGDEVTPKTIVQNYGDFTESFAVTFSFYGYNDTKSVFDLAPGAIDTVEFNNWIAMPGSYLVKSYTRLAGDEQPLNDTTYMEFSVSTQVVHDVGVVQILSPITTLYTGDVVTPTAIVHNFGTENETLIPVYFTIGAYSSTRNISLDAGATDTVEFDDWTAIIGSWTGSAYTALESDINRYNDTARYRFTVIETTMIDISIVDILVPDEPIVTCYDYVPAVLIHTQGVTEPMPCSLLVRIMRFPSRMISFCNVGVDSLNPINEYEEWIYTTVNPGYDTVYLPLWHPYWWDIDWTLYPAYHHVYAEVSTPNDENPNNNTMLNQFTVDGRANDLQMNWTGLLDGYEVMHNETIPNVTYNVASAVSLSEGSSIARFRSWVKIIREADNAVVYTRYKDVTMNAGTYYCIPYSTGWTATEPGSYIVRSWIEAKPGVDVIPENSMWERKYYVMLPVTNANNPLTPSLQSNFGNILTTFKLMANKPNPFSRTTNIQWQIPEQSNVVITIYDATGRNIKTLVKGNRVPGYYSTTWNRTDDNNKKVPAGIYFYELKANNYTARRKMVITN